MDGRLATVNTVEPCDENVAATVWSKPLMMVTTEITAATPTTTPINVNAVRSLLARRLPSATLKDSQTDNRRNFAVCIIKTENYTKNRQQKFFYRKN